MSDFKIGDVVRLKSARKHEPKMTIVATFTGEGGTQRLQALFFGGMDQTFICSDLPAAAVVAAEPENE
jgi:hypothetical protein